MRGILNILWEFGVDLGLTDSAEVPMAVSFEYGNYFSKFIKEEKFRD
jgi:hypothetical protein